MRYYDRYQNFLVDGKQTIVPNVVLPSKTSDKRYVYRAGMSRLDKISQEFYQTPYFGWLIQMANPQYGGMESKIPDGTVLIVPFPLIQSLQDYKNAVDTHFYYYGR
jgi:hypothetical protein|tara:strand:+ start:889 stop:1206 length:318 start_codon:yes stop_codon:yes gene_type:complete